MQTLSVLNVCVYRIAEALRHVSVVLQLLLACRHVLIALLPTLLPMKSKLPHEISLTVSFFFVFISHKY